MNAMTSHATARRHTPKSGVRLAASLAVLLASACAPAYLPPQQVQASNPTVTYKYHSDQDLLTVNQSAANFCTQYQSVAQAATFANDPDGSKVVVYQCTHAMAPVASQPSYNPNLTYNYRSDKELLDASQNARAYCVSNGAQQAISTITPNANGTRTVTFQCSS